MANITTLDDFKRYCLRALGAPVIDIDITDEQMDDRFSEALEKYQEYHFNGTEKVYINHQITQTDIDNRYIPIADEITGIVRVLPFNAINGYINNPFSVEYQIRMSDIWDMTSNVGGSMAYYVNMRQYTALLDQILNGQPLIRYNRYANKLHLDVQWSTKIKLGDHIIIEAYRAVDPTTNPRIFNDLWLKEYTTALFKKQWGANLSKFDGVLLIGGATINGDKIYDAAMEDIQVLEQRLRDEFEEPLPFFVG